MQNHINEETIIKLGKLSNIKVDDIEKTIKDLEGVISFMDNINGFNEKVSKIEEDNSDIWREDIPIKNDVFKELDNSKKSEDYFLVPKILD